MYFVTLIHHSDVLKNRFEYNFFTAIIALVWLVNGFLCKVLGLVPRHEEIVATILGREHASVVTVLIGIAEVAMGIWTLTGSYRKPTASFQILIILTMNTLEFFLIPHLLLWGHFNIVFAVLFCVLIYYHGYRLNTNTKHADIP